MGWNNSTIISSTKWVILQFVSKIYQFYLLIDFLTFCIFYNMSLLQLGFLQHVVLHSIFDIKSQHRRLMTAQLIAINWSLQITLNCQSCQENFFLGSKSIETNWSRLNLRKSKHFFLFTVHIIKLIESSINWTRNSYVHITFPKR
jgi:hypothetical protein